VNQSPEFFDIDTENNQIVSWVLVTSRFFFCNWKYIVAFFCCFYYPFNKGLLVLPILFVLYCFLLIEQFQNYTICWKLLFYYVAFALILKFTFKIVSWNETSKQTTAYLLLNCFFYSD